MQATGMLPNFTFTGLLGESYAAKMLNSGEDGLYHTLAVT